MVALDCASVSLCMVNMIIQFEENRKSKIKNTGLPTELAEKYPIISIEDGMDENDWEGWKYLTELIGDVS